MHLFLKSKITYSLLFLLFTVAKVSAQNNRIISGINDNWRFHKGGTEFANTPDFDDTKWDLVSLPHTWNATDPFNDDQTYFRGIGWYRKSFRLDPALKNKKDAI